MTEMSPLRRRLIEDMTVRNLSPATQRSYVHAVVRFSRFFGRSPDRLGLEDVHTFQVHLFAGGISWPALNQTVCALRFLYGVTLKQADLPERISYARTPRKLPVVLGADEVVSFLEAVPSLKAGAALTTAYAAGLWASEAAGIKVANIDSSRMVIRVSRAKAVGTATSCSHRNCSASCAPTGSWRGRCAGCFLGVMASTRSARPSAPSARPSSCRR
jgi:site-specific recombinase XerD